MIYCSSCLLFLNIFFFNSMISLKVSSVLSLAIFFCLTNLDILLIYSLTVLSILQCFVVFWLADRMKRKYLIRSLSLHSSFGILICILFSSLKMPLQLTVFLGWSPKFHCFSFQSSHNYVASFIYSNLGSHNVLTFSFKSRNFCLFNWYFRVIIFPYLPQALDSVIL